MNRTVNQRRAGTLLSYLQMTLRILIGLVYTPFMIRMMGQNEYGLYQTATSTVAMLSVLSLGFGGSYIRYYTRYRQEEDQASIRKLNGLYLLVFSIMGAVALACGLLLSFHPDVIFDEGLTASEYETARVLMLLLTVSTALSFPATVCTGIISAEQRFVFLKLLGMIRTVLPPLVSVPFLLLGFRSVGLVAVSVILSLLTDLLYLYYVLRVLKHRFTFRDFERGLFKSLFSFTVFIAINLIVDQINQNLDRFLLARYRGTADVAVYSVGATLYQYYVLFSTAVSGVFTPQVHGLVADTADDPNGQRRVLTQLFTKVGRIQFLILGLLATGVIFFGQPFIRLWAGDAYGEAYYVALLLILPSTVALVQNLGIEIQRAQNRHQFRSVAYLLMALVNLGLTVILC
ncbi:MAG: oligosaccharide flippase family protein, partial [Clostridia bacterium]|nr:oligosaccharide flippase family protein [Clostridia bacterium]